MRHTARAAPAHALTAWGILVLVAACSAPAQPAPGPDASTLATLGFQCVPLQRTAEAHLYLRARLNGRRAVALLDTGWSYSTLGAQAAARLAPGFRTDSNASPVVVIERLQLARHTLVDQTMRIEPLLFEGQPAAFDCVLGLDFLRRHFALVDCARGRLYFRAAAPGATDVSRLESLLRRSGFSDVALRRTEPLALTCRLHINRRPVELLVDTAAPWSVLSPGELDRLNLRAEPTLARLTGVGPAGTRPVGLVEPRSVALGETAIGSVQFAVMDLADWGMGAAHTPLPQVGGILGGRELQALEALLDVHGLKLWFRARPNRR